MNTVEDDSSENVSKRGPRELVALDGREISLVDKPAIRRKFLVVKRQEDGTMAIFQADKEAETAKNTESETTDELDNELEAGFTVISKAFDESEDWEFIDVEKAKVPSGFTEKVKAAMPALRKTLSGLEGDERKAAASALSFLNKVAQGKLPFPSFLKPKGSGKAKTQKSEDGMADEKTTTAPAVQISPDGTIQIGGVPVAKAKQFTPERLETLKASLAGLVGLVEETGGIEAVKAALAQGLPSGDLPADVMVSSGVRPVETPGVKKAEDAKVEDGKEGRDAAADALTAVITKALEPVTTKMTELGEKVEAIEKAREPSKSDEGGTGEGNDGKTEVAKAEGEMWSSVI